jgi:hypothetical protein
MQRAKWKEKIANLYIFFRQFCQGGREAAVGFSVRVLIASAAQQPARKWRY